MPEQYIKPLQEKAKAIGLWLLDVPEEYGGAGLDLMSRCVIMEEVARTVAIPFRYAPIFGPEVRPVLFHCNEEQKKRFLLPVIEGKMRICFAQTEPDAGSDPAGDEDAGGKRRRSLHYQWHQALHHRRKARRLRPSHCGHGPAEGRARRRELFHGQHEGAGRYARAAVADDDGRHAGTDSFRKRASGCRRHDRRGRARVLRSRKNGSRKGASAAMARVRSASRRARST